MSRLAQGQVAFPTDKMTSSYTSRTTGLTRMSFRYSSGKGPETWDRPPWDRPPLQKQRSLPASKPLRRHRYMKHNGLERPAAMETTAAMAAAIIRQHIPESMPLTFRWYCSSFLLVPHRITHRLHSAPEARYAALMAELAELWYASSRLQAENETQGAPLR